MPIRMEEDPENERRNDDFDRQRRNRDQQGGGGGGLGQLLPYALMFLMKKPKLLIPALLICGGLYMFGFFDGCLGGGGGGGGFADNSNISNTDEFSFSKGAALSEERFDKAEVFEALSTSYGAPDMPSAATLLRYAPKRAHQGSQGSCVGWATSYAARTILHSRATGENPDRVAFSPSFLYNQIALRGCQGAYMNDAMAFLKQNGTLPFSEFGYDERTCSIEPDRSGINRAKQFRTKGYNRLTYGANNYKIDLDGMKQNLAQGAPVVVGMMVGGTFMQNMRGQKVWRPTRRDYQQSGFGGHAMCVIGYDDNMEGGAFQIMNSWGPEWGQNGVAWVRYNDFQEFTKESYGLYPMGNAENMDPSRLAVKFGLVDNTTQKLIPLNQKGNQLYGTTRPIKAGQKFKVAVTNSIECYVYVFGEETDGSSYVLFPYTEKHSAYCGIVGTRLFPRDYSMVADDLGNRDRIAIVVSKVELPYEELNLALNKSNQGSYQAKLAQVLGKEQIRNAKFNATTDGAIEFDSRVAEGQYYVGAVIELDK